MVSLQFQEQLLKTNLHKKLFHEITYAYICAGKEMEDRT